MNWRRNGWLRRIGLVLLIWGMGELGGVAGVLLRSPTGFFSVQFSLQSIGQEEGCSCWSVEYAGRPVLLDSRLGLILDSGPLTSDFQVLSIRRRKHALSWWHPVCGEWDRIPEAYNEMDVVLQQKGQGGKKLILTFRAYDQGVAVRYTVPKQPGLVRVRVMEERSEFRLGGDFPAWVTYYAQGKYEKVPISRIRPGCERPLVIEAAPDLYIVLGEAHTVDYPRMKLALADARTHTLRSRLDGPADWPAPLTSPWRVVMAAPSPGKLLENNFLFLNLNPPCALGDTLWIRPGKVIREVTLSTEGGKACVDFAVKHGLQYVEYDAGWYGPQWDPRADARTVKTDSGRPLNLKEVIHYANQRGIGIILYVNHLALERQLEQILPLYRSWGVKGIKFGFVHVGPQPWSSWLHYAIRRCADYHLMVDVHDEYRPTGYRRTYPNLMTMEGIRGDETAPDPNQTLAILFTRMLSGPADNTVCWMRGWVRKKCSHTYQMAKTVCIFSPWQFLFWYDRPIPKEGLPPGIRAEIRDRGPTFIAETPELEFFKVLPTTWDETRVLVGEIGQRAAIARRKGKEWFLGCMNGLQDWTLDLPLDFLAPEQVYEAIIYTDDSSVPTPTQVRIEKRRVRRGDRLHRLIPARKGLAARFVPMSD